MNNERIGILKFFKTIENLNALTDRERFQVLFLSALYGLFFLIFFILICFNNQPSIAKNAFVMKDDVFKLYILGWVSFPVAGLLVAWLLETFRNRHFIASNIFYPIFILLNLILLLLTLHPYEWDSLTGISLAVDWVIFQFSGVLLSMLLKGKESFWGSFRGSETLYFVMIPITAFWILCLPCDWWEVLVPQSIFGFLFFIGVIFIFYFGISKSPLVYDSNNPSSPKLPSFVKSIFIYGFVFICIGYLVIDPHFKYGREHLSFYLGPLADMFAGKSLLVNINAQYGILVFYFLKLFFYILPLGYVSFTMLGYILYSLQYLLFYFILRQLFSTNFFALFGLTAFLLLDCFLSQALISGYFPSTGPLRFGLIYVLTALVVLRNRKPRWEKPLFIIEAAVAAISCFWSFEVAVYTLPAYGGMLFYESMMVGNEKFSLKTEIFKGRLLSFLGFGSLMVTFFSLYTFFKTHEWPHWSYYWNYIIAYRNGLGLIPTPGYGPWWAIIAVLYFSIFTLLGFLLHKGKENHPRDLNVAALLTCYGISQFLYFLGRSHPNNLYHISMPSFLLLIYWLHYLRQNVSSSVPLGIQKGLFTLVVVLGGLCLSRAFPIAIDIVEKRFLSPPLLWERVLLGLQDIPRDDGFAIEADNLMKKYSGDRKSLVYFFGEKDLDISMYLGKTESYPYNDVIQADAFPDTVHRILAFDPHLTEGDYIYLSDNLNQVNYEYDYLGELKKFKSTLEQKLLLNLASNFVLKLIEEKKGIVVLQVTAKRLNNHKQ